MTDGGRPLSTALVATPWSCTVLGLLIMSGFVVVAPAELPPMTETTVLT